VTGQAEETAVGHLHFFYNFYNLHYSCSTNIRSRDKARRIYKCRPQSTSFLFCMKKSAAGFIKHVTQSYATIFHQQQSWTDLG
jgi:hypothetical protein